MNLADIRQEARKAASDIEIQWDRIDSDPFYKADFEGTIRMALEAIPQIEHAWTLLQDTPEDWDKRELMLYVAACVGFSAAADQINLGLVAFGHDVLQYWPPRRSRGRAWQARS